MARFTLELNERPVSADVSAPQEPLLYVGIHLRIIRAIKRAAAEARRS